MTINEHGTQERVVRVGFGLKLGKKLMGFFNNFLAYFLRHTLHVLLQSVADQLNYCSRLGNIFEVFLHFCSTYVYTNFPSLFFRQNLIRVLNATDALTQPVVAARRRRQAGPTLDATLESAYLHRTKVVE